MIRIVFYSSSDVLSPREEVFMKGKSAAATDVIYEKMCSAAKMDASDLYDSSSSDSSVLGTGKTPYLCGCFISESLICERQGGTLLFIEP